jgi:hypothetical protein
MNLNGGLFAGKGLRDGVQRRVMGANRLEMHYVLEWKCHNETHYFVQKSVDV